MLNVLSLFSGIGAFEKALENLNIDHEVVGYCEIDKYASKAYSAIHDISEEKNLKDVTKIDILDVEDTVDLITYGFPCQDISNAGKQRGFEHEGELTRSGLFFEALRIIEDYKPKFAIAENVKALLSKKFTKEFNIVLDSLDKAGYNNYWQVLNAKDYGIPQNRERVFIISIRKDIDKGFTFPEPIPLELRLKDLLENNVDEKYYLSEKTIAYFEKNCEVQKEKGNGFRFSPTDGNGTAKSITTRAGSRMDDNFIKQVAQMYPNSGNPQAGRIYSADGISPTMDTCSGGNRMAKVLVREATKKGYAEALDGDSINLEQPNSKTRRGRVGKQVAQTLTTSCNQGVVLNEN